MVAKHMKRWCARFLPQQLKNLYHLMCAFLACVYFGFPAKKLTVIGVTGTNGKTTTAQMIARIVEQSKKRVALASTISFQIADRKWVNASKFTTLSPWHLQKFLYEAATEGCTYAVIETSSHALDQHRVFWIPYRVAVMTNVTREHLDYHQTMEEYRKAKQKLFLRAPQAVLNADMEHSEYFHIAGTEVIRYSLKDPSAHLFAEHIELDFTQTEFTVEDVRFRLHLPGLFNIENALAALGVAKLLGISLSVAKEALENLAGVPGRMELVKNTHDLDIIVDYAVTPDAFEKLYASILPLKIPGSKIIHVFGACGDRDRGKRPMLGEIASRYADIVILTNEDPYFEDPEHIIDEIEKGITKKKDKNYFRIFDRRAAIRKALALGEIGDIILITGKGAEETMAFKAERVLWNDRRVIEEELTKL